MVGRGREQKWEVHASRRRGSTFHPVGEGREEGVRDVRMVRRSPA